MPAELLQRRLDSFTPEYLDFIMSDFIDDAVAEAINKFNLPQPISPVMENGLFLFLSLFLNKIQFTEYIITECNIDILTAEKITDSILNLLIPEMVAMQQATTLALEDAKDDSVKEGNRFQVIQSTPKLSHPYLYVKTSASVTILITKYFAGNEKLIDKSREVIGDIVLGFYKQTDTVPLLQQELNIDPKTAALFGTEVLDLLEKVTAAGWLIPPETAEAARPQSIPTETSPIIPQLRTMASDMLAGRAEFNNVPTPNEAEPIYKSSQPEIEKKSSDAPSYSAPLYQTPKPNADAALEKPRWG